jgi:hypothetical protein
MNRLMSRRIAILAIGFVLVCQAVMTREAVGECTGKYKGGLKPSPAELAAILKQHAAWWKDGGPFNSTLENDPRKANLCEAILADADLSKANLEYANLAGAYLVYADLTGADLSAANLTGANLTGAYLSGADMGGASLKGVSLVDADLTSAGLLDANLTDANMSFAKLVDADLSFTKLAGADLSYAQLAGTLLEFDPSSPPKVFSGIDTAHDLQLVKISRSLVGTG